MSQSQMKVLSHSSYISSLDFLDFVICKHCLYGKQTMSSHLHVSSKQSEPLELAHSNACGLMPIVSLDGARFLSLSLMTTLGKYG